MKEYYDRKVIQKVTPEKLSKLLHEEFSKDGWNEIDMNAFVNPTYGILEVMERVCERINNNDGILNKNHLTCPKCDSTDTSETVTIEKCHSCGFQKDYHNWDHNEPDFK